MNDQPIQSSRDEVIDEFSKWGVGAGVVTVALFPLAIPIIVLTAVALLPLLIPLVAVGILAVPILVLRRLTRIKLGRRWPTSASPSSSTSTAH
jgi:hypothetical protein